MLTAEESQLLTRVGPGTAMGDMMRQYWIPAAKSSELVADGAPVRLALLGEKLIAFRDSSGRVGVMDHRCPHRCASLFYGRNEENGLRCVYHGWKYDVDGNCLDQANVPAHQDFKDKVKARAYPARERNGLVWTYMGPRKEPPPLPAIEAALLPVGMTDIVFVQRECNWLQAIEGEIDTSHFGFLHAGHLNHRDLTPDNPHYYTVFSRTPEYHCAETPWGTMYAAYRDADADHVHYRMAHYLFPFWTEIPQGDFEQHFNARAWVPMDDTHTMFVQLATISARCRSTSRTIRAGTAAGASPRAARTTISSTATPSAACSASPASRGSTPRTRRSPRAWARSSIMPSRPWRRATA